MIKKLMIVIEKKPRRRTTSIIGKEKDKSAQYEGCTYKHNKKKYIISDERSEDGKRDNIHPNFNDQVSNKRPFIQAKSLQLPATFQRSPTRQKCLHKVRHAMNL